MEVKNWEVKEQFRFPQSFGIPKEIKTVKVTPQYEQSEVEDVIQISGIYHITCYVKFEEGEHAHHATSDFTQIEDLDVQGELGYFEYAVPMSVDISKQKIQAGSTPSLSVQDVNSTTTDQEGIEISWIVNCEYETAKEKVVKAEVQEPVVKNEPVAQKEPKNLNVQNEQEESTNIEESELQFILNLDDGYSKLSFPSNYVFVKQKAEED